MTDATNLPIYSAGDPIELRVEDRELAVAGMTLAEALWSLEQRAQFFGDVLTDTTRVEVECGSRVQNVPLALLRVTCRNANAR